MSTVVRFLESLGSSAGFQDYASAVATLAVGSGVRDALLARDVPSLEAQLGARKNLRCLIFGDEN